MRVRVVRCAECGWINASECSHWSMECSRAKKAKKAHHKLKRSAPGFPVMVNGITCSDDLLPDYIEGKVTVDQLVANDPSILDLSPKRFDGAWLHDRRDVEAKYFLPQGSKFVRPPQGLLVTCATECGFTGAL